MKKGFLTLAVLGLFVAAGISSSVQATFNPGPGPLSISEMAAYDPGPGEPHGIVLLADFDTGPGPMSITKG